MASVDHVEYRRFVPAEADLLAEFLTTEDWPYHGPRTRDAAQIRQDAAAGRYDNDEVRTFWIVAETEIGLIRLFDLADDTPLFDLRIRSAYRGAGLGTRALRWLTDYLFTEFPGIRRIEGHTRQDNQAMRQTFRKCGYVKEAHHRQAWPALDALTVEIAPSEQLGNANALYGLASSATRITGPALGGVLVAFAGPAVVVAADAASFAVSVLALSLLRIPRTAPGGRGAPKGLAARRTLRSDMAEGWADFRSRTWLWAVSVQFAFFNLITWAPWMLLGPVMGREYLGGAAVWGAIMAVQGAGAIVAGLCSLGRRPRRPMVVATIGTFCYALPDIPMALHAAAPWVAAAAFGCGAGSAVFNIFSSTATQQQVPPHLLARVNSLTLFPAYGIGVIGYAVDGPLAALLGTGVVFGIGAVYGLASSAVVLALPDVRAVRWRDQILEHTEKAQAPT